MKRIVLLGTGRMGSVIAGDLCRDYEVTCADVSSGALSSLASRFPVSTVTCDLSDINAVKELVAPFDLVIAALPGSIAFPVVGSVIAAGKNLVDISFFNEDPFLLDQLAKEKGVTAIVDCGVAPGLSNLIAGYHHARMKVERFECLVGGLPVVREYPYEYKAPFSPSDVIEEYTRPARLMENGKIVERAALTAIEEVEFEQTGKLEAFNTDGLRTLLHTLDIPDMKEKTLRYPGHASLMKIFRETGFFSKAPVITKDGTSIIPLEFTSQLLFPHWKLEEGEEDFTVMRITVEGAESGADVKYVYTLYDRYDKQTKTTSMARTTGYTCTAAVRMLLENKFSDAGIFPPELVGSKQECFDFIISQLAKRNVKLERKVYDCSRNKQVNA